MKEYLDTITLGLERNLIVASGLGKEGKLFPLKELNQSMAEAGKSTQSFGLFDTATPNFSNYYPEVTKQDLDPEADPDGFVYPVFRALSMVTVRKDWDPVDFSANDGQVLKDSMPMLLGLSIYPNHEMMVGNELGSIVDYEWQDAYKDKTSGIEIPGGIIVRLKIDGKSNPKVARGVMMKPPSIHSSSVTVEFAWTPSHPDIPIEEFRSKVGTYDDKGQLIRRVASKIRRYYEMSFVPHGADPYAQKLDSNNKIVNPLLGHNRDSFSENFNGSKGFYTFSFRDIASYSESNKPPKPVETPIENPINNPNMNQKLRALCALMAISVDGLTEEQMVEKLSEKLPNLKTESDKVTQLTADLQKAKSDLDKEKLESSKVAGLNTQIEKLKAFEGHVRSDFERIYKLAAGDKVEEATLTLIKDSELATLSVLMKPYIEKVENTFEASCEECGSNKVTRQSSKQEGGDPNSKKFVPKTNEEVSMKLGAAESGKTESLWA
jgi:hypothetical protein